MVQQSEHLASDINTVYIADDILYILLLIFSQSIVNKGVIFISLS